MPRHAMLIFTSDPIPYHGTSLHPSPFSPLPLHLIREEKRQVYHVCTPSPAKNSKYRKRKTRASSLKAPWKRHNSNTIKATKQSNWVSKQRPLPPFLPFLRGQRNGLYTMFSRGGSRFLPSPSPLKTSKPAIDRASSLETMNFNSSSFLKMVRKVDLKSPKFRFQVLWLKNQLVRLFPPPSTAPSWLCTLLACKPAKVGTPAPSPGYWH